MLSLSVSENEAIVLSVTQKRGGGRWLAALRWKPQWPRASQADRERSDRRGPSHSRRQEDGRRSSLFKKSAEFSLDGNGQDRSQGVAFLARGRR